MNTEVQVEVIDEHSPYLPIVKALRRANSKTVGDFTNGAFADHAARRNIIVAIAPGSECIGYLLYRCSYDRITIVHLCVDRLHQGKGIAKILVNYLKKITKEDYSGIGLHCRRDFKLEKLWYKLDFVAQHDKVGTSKDGKLLTYWWFDHGHTDLFDIDPKQKLASRLCVIIDTKIFGEIYTEKEDIFAESKSLFADWLQPEIELCITDEIFNKINLIAQNKERNQQRNFAKKNFTCLSSHQNFDYIIESLNGLFSKKQVIIDELEVRNLARAIASDSQNFVTLNNQLLELKSEIYDQFKLSIFRPNELITHLDELRRNLNYQPVRLAGTTRLEQIRVKKGQEDLLTNYFYCDGLGESKAQFQQKLRQFITESDKFECCVVREGENQLLALVVYGRQKKHELEIPMLRVGNNSLSATLVRHLIFKSILRSACEQREFTRITDSCLTETVTTAIEEDTFIRVKNGWLKANLAVVETASQLSIRLTDIGNTLGQEYKFCLQLADSLNTENLIQKSQASADIERFLFPAKIMDAEIPTFIIPIQPRWAQDLFDEGLANQTLFGAKDELAFNRESVYYRAVQNSRGLQAPCRILWYVSGTQGEGKGKGYCEVQAVRACSYVDEVVIGKPKELYQNFQRLGVYNLSDLEKVNKDKDGNIMAIRFSDIELFDAPIYLKELMQISEKNLSLNCPEKISTECFMQVYNLGVMTSRIS
jgi:rRNA-processing protein FCF1/GNAT superfamily N-acetyltransferase